MSFAGHVHNMLPGSLGGSTRVITPRSPIPQQPRRSRPAGKVWGNDIDVLEWVGATGAPVSGSPTVPPDPDVTGAPRSLYPGGSDGQHHYLLAIDDAGEQQVWVDQFDRAAATLLARFQVPTVKNSPTSGTLYGTSFDPSTQYVSASSSRVVAIVDQWDSSVVDPITGGDGHSLIVTVFDTAGTLLAQHAVYTTTGPGAGDYSEGVLEPRGGSFCDGVNVYFWHDYWDAGGATIDEEVAKVNLATGVLTPLFNRPGVGALSPGASPTWIDLGGLVAVDDSGSGDLVCVGDNIARVGQDGVPVWFTANPDPGDVEFYLGCARSGRASVWASGPGEDFGASESAIAHEFGFDGVYRQASAFNPEPVDHTWLGPN